MPVCGDRQPNVFEAKHVTKRFGPVTAFDGVDFELWAGEVMGVIGDNGAGKSALIEILSEVVGIMMGALPVPQAAA